METKSSSGMLSNIIDCCIEISQLSKQNEIDGTFGRVYSVLFITLAIS